MERLSKLKLNKLKNLNLYGISLVDDSAVDSLLRMNLDLLTDLNIGSTSISSSNAIKVLQKINTKNMKSLNLSNPVLIQHTITLVLIFIRSWQNCNSLLWSC